MSVRGDLQPQARVGRDEEPGAGTFRGEHCMDGTRRADIRPGSRVSIVLKKDQQTGKRTEGVVKDILTKSPTHPHGVKVRLEGGEVGRVKEILD
jgi:uncharacterized repeat protein (TIGR03833 family)